MESTYTKITLEASRSLGFLRSVLKIAPSSLKCLAYKSFVRPKIEYASSVWDPSLLYLARNLEAVQNRASRFIANEYSRYSSMTEIKATLGLSDLSLRRKLNRICLFHRIYHHISILRRDYVRPPVSIRPRIDHSLKCERFSCKTDLFFNSFFPRAISEWNSLPADLVEIRDPDIFRKSLISFYAA